jgi:hypothetical protein
VPAGIRHVDKLTENDDKGFQIGRNPVVVVVVVIIIIMVKEER